MEAEVAVFQQFMDSSNYINGVLHLDYSDLTLWQKIGIHATGLSTVDYMANVQINYDILYAKILAGDADVSDIFDPYEIAELLNISNQKGVYIGKNEDGDPMYFDPDPLRPFEHLAKQIYGNAQKFEDIYGLKVTEAYDMEKLKKQLKENLHTYRNEMLASGQNTWPIKQKNHFRDYLRHETQRSLAGI